MTVAPDSEPLLRINEIYVSLQGEGRHSGVPFVFVRTTGCALRCVWCDTAYAFTEGDDRPLSEVRDEVLALAPRHVLLTGGEPLEQPAIGALAAALLDAGRVVLVETGGHVDLAPFPDGLVRILDVKCPGSRMDHRNHWPNLTRLGARDEVKFVLRDRPDFEYAERVIDEHGLEERVGALLYSPVHGELDPAELSRWLLESPRRNARMNLQLHKYIWPAAARGV